MLGWNGPWHFHVENVWSTSLARKIFTQKKLRNIIIPYGILNHVPKLHDMTITYLAFQAKSLPWLCMYLHSQFHVTMSVYSLWSHEHLSILYTNCNYIISASTIVWNMNVECEGLSSPTRHHLATRGSTESEKPPSKQFYEIWIIEVGRF